MWCYVCDGMVHPAYARFIWIREHVWQCGWEEWKLVPTHWVCFEANRESALYPWWYDPNEW